MARVREEFSRREEILLLANGILWTPKAIEDVQTSTGASLAWHWAFLLGTVGLGAVPTV